MTRRHPIRSALSFSLCALLGGLAFLAPPAAAQDGSSREAILERLRARAEARRQEAEARTQAEAQARAEQEAMRQAYGIDDAAAAPAPTQLASVSTQETEPPPIPPLPDDLEGFEPVEREAPVRLTYAVASPRGAEFMQELQAMIRIQGVEGLVPYHRLYQIGVQYEGKDEDGNLQLAYKVFSAKRSVSGEDGIELASDPEAEGAVLPVTLSPDGRAIRTLPGQNRILGWLRLPLPEDPIRVGHPWTATIPLTLGDRTEVSRALYVLQHLVRTEGHLVAVIRGRFAIKGQAGEQARFGSMGQERILFDVDDGVILFREFRFEGGQARKLEDRVVEARTRVKGLVFETGIFRDIEVSKAERFQQVARLLGDA